MKPREGKGPIQKIAYGLLGFFQLKDQGNPAVLSDELQGIIDLGEWYRESNSTYETAVSAVAITNNQSGFFAFTTNPLVVPQDEIWFVPNFSVYVAAPLVSDTIAIAPGGRFTTTNADFLLGPVTPDGTGINRAVASAATDFWALPGTQLGVFIGKALTATNLPVVGTLRAVKYPI